LNRTPSNAEKVPSIRDGESTIPLGYVGGNRKCHTIELIDEETVTSRELLLLFTREIREIDRFLINDQLFESECHEDTLALKVSRKLRVD